MQGYRGKAYTLDFQAFHNGLGEVRTRRGGGYGARMLGEDRLKAFPVGILNLAARDDFGRQGRFAQLIHQLHELLVRTIG